MQSKLDQGNGKIKGTDRAEGNCYSIQIVLESFQFYCFTRWRVTSCLGPILRTTLIISWVIGFRMRQPLSNLRSPLSR